MALYRRGTASMDADGTVHGTDTKWKDQLALIRVGATIVFLEQPIKLAVISDIVSDTELKAISTDGQTAANGKYVILLNDSLTVNGLAQNVAETLRYYQSKETEIAAAIDLINQLDMNKLEQIVAEVNQAKSDSQSAKNKAELARDAANAARDETNSIKNQARQIVDGAVGSINAAKEQAITDVGSKESAAITHIDTEEKAAIKAINDAKGDLSGYVNNAHAAAQNATSAKNDAQAARDAAVSSKDAAAASAQEAADYAASLDASNLLKRDLNLSDVPNKTTARDNLDVYSREECNAILSGYDGFNKIGRVLNIPALQTVNPPAAGITVYVSSAFSATEAQEHRGGGLFHSVPRSGMVNDFGIVVFPEDDGEFCWKRVDYSSYNAEFWGVVADGSTDNAVAISRAMDYARLNRVVIKFPAGNIHTSEAVPIFSNCGISGSGARVESTVFYKTTNNPYSIFGAISVDAMCVMVPQSRWDIVDHSMESFNVHGRIEGCHFRRLGLNSENVATTRPQYGLFMGKAGSPVIRDSSFEGAYIGIKAYSAFSGVIARTSITQFDGYGYSGLDISAYDNGTLYLSGTSMDLRNIGVRGYQLGFSIGRLQYSTMTNCHAEQISPLLVTPNERAWAFEFINPYGITMQGCATEFVKGGQINVRGFTDASFGSNLSVFGYVAIDQQSPTVPTPYYQVDGGGNTVNVIFQGCELGVASLTNLTQPVVSSSGTKVVYIANSNAAPPEPTRGAQVVALA